MYSWRAACCIMANRVTVKGKQMKLAPRRENVWGNEDVVPYTLEGVFRFTLRPPNPCRKTAIPTVRDGGRVPQPV